MTFKKLRRLLNKACLDKLWVTFIYTHRFGNRSKMTCRVVGIFDYFFKAIEEGKSETFDYLLGRVKNLHIIKI